MSMLHGPKTYRRQAQKWKGVPKRSRKKGHGFVKRVNGRRKENGTEETPAGEKEEAEERRGMGNEGEVAMIDDGPFVTHDK